MKMSTMYTRTVEMKQMHRAFIDLFPFDLRPQVY